MRIRYTGWGGINVNGHRQAGDVFEIGDREGRVLIAEGRAEVVAEEDPVVTQPVVADPVVRRKR